MSLAGGPEPTAQRPLVPQSVVERAPVMLFADLDGTAVMFLPSRNAYFDADTVGGEILRMLDAPAPVSEICRRLLEEFDVEADACEREVLTFLDEAIRQGLVRRLS
jgi:hypothetical protein